MKLRNIEISNDKKLFLLAGPCAIESRDHALMCAEKIKSITDKMNVDLVYKSSFDKANRTSIKSPRGVGIDKGLRILEEIKTQFNVPVVTDVHEKDQCAMVGDVVDIIQIPAFLCRQTDLLIAAAETGKIINVKKGQFLAPEDTVHIVNKLKEAGSNNIMLCERGTSFGYNNLVVDMKGLKIMKDINDNVPIVFDATHSVQKPGGLGGKSGGDRELVSSLALAASTFGIAALFTEVHNDPDNAFSDGPNMLNFIQFEKLLTDVLAVDRLIKKY